MPAYQIPGGPFVSTSGSEESYQLPGYGFASFEQTAALPAQPVGLFDPDLRAVAWF